MVHNMIKVVLVDTCEIYMQGLKSLLDEQPDMECLETISNMKDIINILTNGIRAQIIVMDPVMLAPKQLQEMVIEVNKLGIYVLILTYEKDLSIVHDAVQSGVKGFISKGSKPQHIIDSIRLVACGKNVFDIYVNQFLSNTTSYHHQYYHLSKTRLHERELSILESICKSKTNRQISIELGLSERTVASHISNIFRKLNTNSRAGAAAIAVKIGLVSDLNG